MSQNGSLYEGLEMAKRIFSWPVLATSFILIRLQNLSQKYKYICIDKNIRWKLHLHTNYSFGLAKIVSFRSSLLVLGSFSTGMTPK